MRECAGKIVIRSSSSSTSSSRGNLKQLHIRSIASVLRGCCQFERDLCQLDRDRCQFYRELCQFDSSLCQFDKHPQLSDELLTKLGD